MLPAIYYYTAFVASKLLSPCLCLASYYSPAGVASKLLLPCLYCQQVTIPLSVLPASCYSPACIASNLLFPCLYCQQVTIPLPVLPASYSGCLFPLVLTYIVHRKCLGQQEILMIVFKISMDLTNYW